MLNVKCRSFFNTFFVEVATEPIRMVKTCIYPDCKTDSRFFGDPEMQYVKWVRFPKPSNNAEKCRRWIELLGGPNEMVNVDKIKRWTYICTLHFVNQMGPTVEHPDPLPVNNNTQFSSNSTQFGNIGKGKMLTSSHLSTVVVGNSMACYPNI